MHVHLWNAKVSEKRPRKKYAQNQQVSETVWDKQFSEENAADNWLDNTIVSKDFTIEGVLACKVAEAVSQGFGGFRVESDSEEH